MVTILPHTTRASGTLLTATIYNADHQNHVTNATTINAAAAYVAVSNTWAAGQTFSTTLISGASTALVRDINTDGLRFYGGTAALGASIKLLGGAHATDANEAFYDAAVHNFRDQPGTGLPVVTINGNTVWHAGNDSGADVGFLNGQNAAFYQNGSNITSGTVADARLPSTLNGKTFTSDIVVGTVGSSNAKITSGGAIELCATSGTPLIDFKNLDADDYDVRIIQRGANSLDFFTAGSTGSLFIDNQMVVAEDGSSWNISVDGNAAGLSHATVAVVDISGERFRFNAEAFLSNQLTVPKTLGADSGTGLSLHKDGIVWVSREGGVQIITNRDTNDGQAIQFNRAKTTVGNISVTASATAYNTSSDERLKHDFRLIDPSIIDRINVYNFAWRSNNERAYGVTAQELIEIVPQAVTKGKTEEDMMDVDYSKLVPLLIAKVQNLEARLAALEI